MEIVIRTIESRYDIPIGNIIRTVGAEFGAIGEGFGPSDEEVSAMSQHYGRDASSQYWVALVDGEVMGGVGIAPFNERSDVCEVRKLFLLPQVRGLGLGKKLLQQALTFARNAEFGFCYLDTLGNMQSAIALYEKFGFEHLSAPLEGTEHNGCDIWMMKKLS